MAKAEGSNNGNIVRWIGIVVAIGLTVAGWVYTLGVNGERLKINLTEDAMIHPRITENRESIIAMKKDLEIVQRDVAQQTLLQKQILDKQDQILRAVTIPP